MQRRAVRALALTAAVALATFTAACGDDDTDQASSDATPSSTSTTSSISSTTTTGETTTTEPSEHRIEIVVRDGEVVGGDRREEVPMGEPVVIAVESDVSDHVHLLGYDLFADVAPGSPAEIRFTADLAGIWEVELEDRGLLLLRLEVS